jgi:hypothetical protein
MFSTVSSRRRPCQIIRPTGNSSGGVARQRQGAAIQHVDHAGVAQQQGIDPEEGFSRARHRLRSVPVAGATSASGGPTMGTVGDSTAS